MKSAKQIIESILFTSSSPVSAGILKAFLQEVLGDATVSVNRLVQELRDDYESTGRSFGIDEIAGGYVLNTLPDYGDLIKRFHKTSSAAEGLSASTFETLSIIAYKQPVTRGEIELIRGVSCSNVLQQLMERGLIKVGGKKDIPGRPYLYVTTKKFLEYFRLKSIKDLPELKQSEFRI